MEEKSIIEKLGITKGPWKWVLGEDFDYLTANGVDDLCEAIIDDGSANGEYNQTIKGDSPNAKIIASAPEMLEALIGIVEFLPDLKSLPIKTKTAHGEATRKVVNAIQKATGKSWEEIKGLL